MKVEQYIQRLDAEQTRLAREALERPSGKDAFEYGRAAGMHAGMEHAKRLLVEMFAEKERRDFSM